MEARTKNKYIMYTQKHLCKMHILSNVELYLEKKGKFWP